MDRRTFLKFAGIGGISFAWGCGSNSDRNIFSRVTAQEDHVTGNATWYASTCMECPAGCGVLAKNREGRVIKLEGNPHHPVNRGKLCIRGQAALQGVYDPDRLSLPQLKVNGTFKSVSFEKASNILKQRAVDSSKKGKDRVKMLTGITGEPLFTLFSDVLAAYGSPGGAAAYEPFSHDSLKNALGAIFHTPSLPGFHMEKADFILNFGADFTETWLSPVEYIRKFKSMHAADSNKGKKGMYIHAGPYMSLTAANADKFLPLAAGREYIAAMGVIRYLLQKGTYPHLTESFTAELRDLAAPFDPPRVEKSTGLVQKDQALLADTLMSAKHPLVLGSNGTTTGDASLALDMAVTLINLLLDRDLSLYDFDNSHALERAMTAKETARFFETAVKKPAGLFLFHNTNPVFTFPSTPHLTELFDRDDIYKVCFSSVMDETAEQSDLVIPVQLPLETWDAYESRKGIVSTIQPAMGRLTNAPSVGDIFLKLSGAHAGFENYYQYLVDFLCTRTRTRTKTAFIQMIRRGGVFDGQTGNATPFIPEPASLNVLKKAVNSEKPFEREGLRFLAVPSLRLYDGRGANRSWLSEVPDPVTGIAWLNMLMVHPETLEEYGFAHGDIMEIKNGRHAVKAPVYSFSNVSPGLIVMQTGQGHTACGRFAQGYGSSPVKLLEIGEDAFDFISWLVTPDRIKKAGHAEKLPRTDGSRSQYKRKIALSVAAGPETGRHHKGGPHKKEGYAMNEFPLTLPTKEGYDKKRDFYPPHAHDGYRWGMIVDLDRCVGCSACAAACYAENNLGVVGKTQIEKGREMAWLRIERYQDQTFPGKLIFLPMMCQHCDNAPCESVCPVYAPHHSKEGLNNQIYNRCIGTRFCAQNCPYKVRRFNWFTWQWPDPLNLQLNPDVTVRTKGVMEKCSFCIQRIKDAHNKAKNERRDIRDGEIQPACVQTCPADALIFGDFMDKNSAVSRLARHGRAYQVLGYLNTKPAVIYLKKTVHEI